MATKSTKTTLRKPYSKVANPPVKHNSSWTVEDNEKLTKLLLDKYNTRTAAEILGRTVASVWSRKAQLVREGIVPSKRFASSKTGNKYGKYAERHEEIEEIPATPSLPLVTYKEDKNAEKNKNLIHGILKVLSDNGANSLIEMRDGKIKSIVLE